MKLINSAKNDIEKVLINDPNNIIAWNVKGMIHNRKGEEALSELVAAEVSYRKGQFREAKMFASRAKKKLEPNSPSYLRALDILELISNN